MGSSNAVTSDHIELPDSVIDLIYSMNQPLDPWCELQTPSPHFASPNDYSCVPDFGGGLSFSSTSSGAPCDLVGPNDTSACSAEQLANGDIGTCFAAGPVLGRSTATNFRLPLGEVRFQRAE